MMEPQSNLKRRYAPMDHVENIYLRHANRLSETELRIENKIKSSLSSFNMDTRINVDIFKDLLDSVNINYTENYRIGDEIYDFLVEDNIVINICPTYSHNTLITETSKYGVHSALHRTSYHNALYNRYRCIHIFDWDDPIVIVSNMLKPDIEPSGKYSVEKLSNTEFELFALQHDIVHKVQRHRYEYGLFEDDELVAVGTFCLPRNKDYELELIQYIETSIYDTSERIERLIKHVADELKVSSIVTYLDNSKQDVNAYIKAGFNHLKDRPADRFWSKGIERRSDTAFATLPKEKLFGENNKNIKLHTYLIQEGWLPVYDCGKSVCVWEGNTNDKIKDADYC